MKHQLKSEKTALLLTTTILLFLVAAYYRSPRTFAWMSRPSPSPQEHCDLFRGDWVPDPDAPYYTNETCTTIHDHQNCMKHGRPDTGFMRWRWKPEGCELPRFDAEAFLDLVKGKSMAFVGDSVARNHMQSLMCLLSRQCYSIEEALDEDRDAYQPSPAPSEGCPILIEWLPLQQVTNPVSVSETSFFYTKYNFTVVVFWSTFLVKVVKTGPDEVLDGAVHLHIDTPDMAWTAHIESFDYVIVSAGQWFFRPSFSYKENKIVGCFKCNNFTIPKVDVYYAYRHAFRSTFAYLNNLAKYNGTTFLRTYSPSHYENGTYNTGGDCVRTRPTKRSETRLEGNNLSMRRAQVEEFKMAKEEATKKGLRYHLLDITEPMALRPDGHPSRYGHLVNANTTIRDCVHWCLPGPIDSWSDILLEMLKKDKLNNAFAKF